MMKNRRPLHWWEEFFGLDTTKKPVARKMWKAYAGYAYTTATAVPLCAALGSTPMICQARTHEVDPHTPSQTNGSVVLEFPRMIVVASTSSSSGWKA
jgi:trans-aconitate methyltransferase